MNKNIVLIGFMGSGKSTIGINLSYLLKRQFFDIDNEIEKKYNMKITNIFEKYGEDYFREIETKMVIHVSNAVNSIIALGGGTVKNSNNMTALKKNGIVVYLKSHWEHIYKNTLHSDSRPLLENGNRIEIIKSLLYEREPLYEKYSDIIIETNNLPISEISSKIKKQIGII